jgi:hypothetical protein
MGCRRASAGTETLDGRRPRIAPEKNGLSVWSSEIFSEPGGPNGRSFLSRVFQVPEVDAVEIIRSRAVGRLRYAVTTPAPEIWRKLKNALLPAKEATDAGTVPPEGPDGIEDLYLDLPRALPIRVTRFGSTLSTWQVQVHGRDRVRLAHPLLRNRKDIAHRVEEELDAILGVREFRTNIWTSTVLVRFDARILEVRA